KIIVGVVGRKIRLFADRSAIAILEKACIEQEAPHGLHLVGIDSADGAVLAHQIVAVDQCLERGAYEIAVKQGIGIGGDKDVGRFLRVLDRIGITSPAG